MNRHYYCAALVAVASLLSTACGSDSANSADAGSVPDEPTWFADIQPLIQTNCAGCHGAVPIADSVADFRLDRYVKNDPNRFDSYDYRELIVAHAANRDAPVMPPTSELSDVAKETLRRWVEQGARKGERSNAAPSAERLAPTAPTTTADQQLSLMFRSFDDDGDGLISDVGYRALDGSGEVMLFEGLPTGQNTLDIDTGQLVSLGHFQVFARLDDGHSDDPSLNQYDVVLIEDVLVDHGARGTAPTVAVLNPNGGDTVIGETAITWSANDPDIGDELSIDIDLVRLDASGQVADTTSLATALPNSPASFAWDPADAVLEENGTPIDYKIRITATDSGAQNTRSDESDAAFTIAAAGATSLTWDDVRPIFVTYCGECHSQPAKTMALEYFRLDKYNAADTQAPSNSDSGVFEQRSLVYQRMVVAKSMPPNAQAQPSQSELDQVGEWILAGAPFGAGGGNAPPSFTWITPNDASTTQVGNANVTLAWMIDDPEGLPLLGSISMAELPNGVPPLNPATATCDGTEPGYALVVANANIEDESFSVTLPNAGYFCFKAEVTDDAGQSLVSTASRPVKL